MEVGDIFRKLYDMMFHRPMNFSFVDEHVCGSARIMSEMDVDWLVKRGVDAIISLTEERVPSTWLDGKNINYKHIPVKNHRAPTTNQLEECVNFIDHNGQHNGKTLIHCAAGKGRTGTVIAAYICHRDNVSAEISIEQIRALRSASVEKNPASGQEQAVKSYALSQKTKFSKETKTNGLV